MNTHGALTDYSLSHSLIDHIGKGREGKGRELEGSFSCSHPSPFRTASLRARPESMGMGTDR